MKQTDNKQLEASRGKMRKLKEIRGGKLLPFHRKIANDPNLLQSFQDVFTSCNRGDNVIPQKYRELMIMLMGCSRGVETTIKEHGRKALEAGASIQEIGEALRISLMMCGATSIIPAAELFEELEEE